jgi:signal transduction histidine kinase
LYRRAILIYIGTIVVPMAAFLWLGVDSFEQQRQLLVARTNERVAAETQLRTRRAAEEALAPSGGRHPIVQHRFTIENGQLVLPALRAPLPDPVPEAFSEPLRLESNRPDLALLAYRRLLEGGTRPSLALEGIARCFDRMGRGDEARDTWRTLARMYPDERTLSHRPYGIVAAINAGDTAGLFERIASGRWDLAAEHAEYFLHQLDPNRSSEYLDQFTFARALEEHFRPFGALGEGVVYSEPLTSRTVWYRADGPNRIIGLSANQAWINGPLTKEIEREFDLAAVARRDLRIYGGAVLLVSVLLSVGVVLLLRDVTREANTNRSRAELVSSVSHELKTPITLVRLYSETLLRHRGFSEEDRRDFYRIIARESTRLGRLIDQVLTFSRVDRGAQVYHFEEGDVTTLVSGVVDDYREYLENAGFTLRQTLPATAPFVRFDGVAISQALINLLDNAVKYSGNAREIDVRVNVANGHVAVEVEDHGIGISPDDQRRVFDRFYRVASASPKGGYGLGLFLVGHIMEAHGGRVEVESSVGQGSRFRLVIPAST